MMAGCTSQHPIRWRNPSMAQRLSLDERARIEAMITAGVSVAEAALRLERDPSTIHRELALNRGGAYDAEAAQAGRADPRRPSSSPTPLWPRRSERCSLTGCHRTRSALWSPATARRTADRRALVPRLLRGRRRGRSFRR